MTARTAILQGIPVSRGPARGLLIAGKAVSAGGDDLASRVARVAAVAAAHAGAVDAEARLPAEAIAAARAERLLGIAVPREFGGEDAGISGVADICYALGQACSSTAIIYAMHQTKVACIARHGRGSAWHQLMMRRLCGEQMLLASSTTEGDRGGDIRNSAAAVETRGKRIALERNATVISYGEAADGIVTTARRSADAAGADQVLLVFLKNDYTLEPQSGWDTLGMRGTCSSGFRLVASAAGEQILPVSYSEIHSRTMMPVAHLLWSSAWAGIAAASVDRARLFVRTAMQTRRRHASARRSPPHPRQRVIAEAARACRRRPAALRGCGGTPDRAGFARFSDSLQPAQGERIRTRRRDGDERHADVRAVRLSQRQRVQHGTPSARHFVIAGHDQQRPDPRKPCFGVAP